MTAAVLSTQGADVFRFFGVVTVALYLGGAARLVYTYRKHPPKLTVAQRRKFVFGALMGGSLLIVGFTINVLTRQNEQLAPGTPVGVIGVITVLLTIYVLLWYGKPPKDGKGR